MKTILDLNHLEAREFFLKQSSYCNIDLPSYFDFQKLLNTISQNIKDKRIEDVKDNKDPKTFDNVNCKLYVNKDGKLSWRRLQLLNPVIYVCLVNRLTDENNWQFIVDRFKEFRKNDNIICTSIPIVSDKKKDTIINWWGETEQRSIELAIDFSYMFVTDISDCYGSIYTHSIAWSLHEIKEAKAKKDDKKLLGNIIDKLIRSFQYDQTNGIPQGSVLMDFIAEIVLGYADLMLSRKIEGLEDPISEYKIIRYRDDYRIYGKDNVTVSKIAALLSNVLADLNFKLNSQKTSISTNVVMDSIKPDKYYAITNSLDKLRDLEGKSISFQKELLKIHSLSMQFPNSGSIQKLLTNYYKLLYPIDVLQESIRPIISIVADIAFNNPKIYPIFCSIIAKLLSFEPEKGKVDSIKSALMDKFSNVPNNEYLKIWAKRVDKDILFDKESLCVNFYTQKINKIWNLEWVKNDIRKQIEGINIVDMEKMESLPAIPEPSEVSLFVKEFEY